MTTFFAQTIIIYRCFTIIIVKWTVRDTSPKLGQDLTLFCEVDNYTVFIMEIQTIY
jgi:hypothetical protein